MNNSPFESHFFGALDTVLSDNKKKMFSMTETGHFLRSFSVVDILVVNFLDFSKTVRLNTKVTVPECV